MVNDKQRQIDAAKDYASGMKYKDIASKYGVSPNTVKSWRQRNGWSRDAPASKKGAPIKPERVHPKKVVQIVKEADLPEKRKLFAMLYLQRFNATWAYMKAYGASYETAMSEGSKLLRNPKVKALIDELKAEHTAQLDITAVDVLREYAKQANSDIGDYVEFGSEDLPIYTDEGAPIIDSETGKQKTVRRSFVHLRDQSEVDTSLIKSVRNGRDGPVIELYDRQHAQDALVKALPETDGDKQITKVVLHRHNRTDGGAPDGT
jgi:phage terminase small subunit